LDFSGPSFGKIREKKSVAIFKLELDAIVVAHDGLNGLDFVEGDEDFLAFPKELILREMQFVGLDF